MENESVEDLDPKQQIMQCPATITQIAKRAKIDIKTAMWARDRNRWPAQQRTRTGLQQALKAFLTEDACGDTDTTDHTAPVVNGPACTPHDNSNQATL